MIYYIILKIEKKQYLLRFVKELIRMKYNKMTFNLFINIHNAYNNLTIEKKYLLEF